MATRVVNKAHSALTILRVGGPGPFVHHLRCQLYDQATFLALARFTDEPVDAVPCTVDYQLDIAKEADMEEVGGLAKSEGGESAWELIGRKWYFESGFRDCYIARTRDTGELCFLQFMVSLPQYQLIAADFRHRLPPISEDEVWLENSYTFRKFRGKKVMSSVLVDLGEVAKQQGIRRMVTYIREDNIPSIKGCERAGFKVFGSAVERKLLFGTTRDYGNGHQRGYGDG